MIAKIVFLFIFYSSKWKLLIPVVVLMLKKSTKSSLMAMPILTDSAPGPSNTDDVLEEDCDTDAEEIIENRQENSDTEQSDTNFHLTAKKKRNFIFVTKEKEKR